MPNFFGSYTYTVDSKGRVNIPAPFRSQLPEPSEEVVFYVTIGPNTKGTHKCLSIFLKGNFEAITSGMKKECGTFLSPKNNKRKNFLKMMGNAQLCKWDNQGRIIIPKELLEKAEISDKVKIVGSVDLIELWNPARFAEYTEEDDLSE